MTRSQPSEMSFIDALNDPDLRRIIDGIDDLWASLDHGDRREPVLEELIASEVFLIRARGFDYDPRPENWAADRRAAEPKKAI